MLGGLEKVIKVWISLKCSNCGKLNPIDTTKCIYCVGLLGGDRLA